MPMIKAYKVCFRAPVSVFTGLGIAGLVDRVVARNSEGLPCIPGSTLKGRWRFFAERLLRSGAALSSVLKIHGIDAPWCKDRQTACTLCRLFGNPALAAMLQVGQGELLASDKTLFADLLKQNSNPVVHPDAELRPGVALSRRRRVAVPDHLFLDEAIPALHFQGPLELVTTGPNPNDERINQEIAFLKAAGRLVDSLGARKAVGRGSLEDGIVVIEE